LPRSRILSSTLCKGSFTKSRHLTCLEYMLCRFIISGFFRKPSLRNVTWYVLKFARAT
jgi:hypothetical protein